MLTKKKTMLSAVALGAAYLLRNKESRQKLKDQFRLFGQPKQQTT